MRKLLLTSDGFDNLLIARSFLTLVEKHPSEVRVLFIPTASQVEQEIQYVEESRKELISLEIKTSNIVDVDLNTKYSNDELLAFDAIYVCGGNTFYLLKRLRETNFDKSILQMVAQGITYVGVSAGSIIAGPDIAIASAFDANDVMLSDLEGLSLAEQIITPHFQHKEEPIISEYERKSGHVVTRLKNGQALEIKDDVVSVIG